MEEKIVVKTENLVKRYGKIAALSGLSINVPEKSIYGLVGPNGAGKTTTLGILSTLVYPTSGRASIFGHDVVKEAEKLRGIVGILPQNAALYSGRTAVDIMTFYSMLSGLSKKDAAANANRLLDNVGLEEHKHKKIREMSNGMVKLVGIAQALIGNPKLIMLDEATAGLDPRVAYNIRKIVKGLKKHATIIFSSHNLYEVEELCDYVGIINQGRVILEGKTHLIIRKKKSLEKVFMEKTSDHNI